MSYLDNLDFGVVACPELVDDVWIIADGLRTSLDELLALVPEPEPEPDTINLDTQPEHSQS
ncbi:MAG: WS/DGAT domain-containing protein [Acidimicrobiales bacterium]|nr:WS/DGAT domain-containing protein [Acidimicrobiales bacterium]